MIGWITVLDLLSKLIPVLIAGAEIVRAWNAEGDFDKEIVRVALLNWLPEDQVEGHMAEIERILSSIAGADRMQVELGHELAKVAEKVGGLL